MTKRSIAGEFVKKELTTKRIGYIIERLGNLVIKIDQQGFTKFSNGAKIIVEYNV